MELSDFDRSVVAGQHGPAAAFAMDVLLRFARTLGAPRFLDISQAHIDGCLYHGEVSLDFVERLVQGSGRVRVPATLNVGLMDLIHPELIHLASSERDAGRRLMQAHIELGCQPSFTCAPYQTRFRPVFGQQIAWGESNAIVFANSVIGARTNRYGDFIDLCCAMTGRAPASGLHTDEGRRGQILFRLRGFPPSLEPADSLYVGVGYIVGERSGLRIPVIDGLPPPRSEDQLKALGAVAASSGSVAMFHAVGITPEAATLADAFGGYLASEEVIAIRPTDVSAALARLSTVPDGSAVSAVSIGTPHFSPAEFRSLIPLLPGFRPAPGVEFYINTSREVYGGLAAADVELLNASGITLVMDTCTYITSIIRGLNGVVMTNSGKWAHYAPANLGVDVAFGSVEDCLASAAAGAVVRR